MSSIFTKNKEKRSRSATGESNSSFVRNVTSRMSGLLPATITRWFSSPSSSSANGSAPTADISDSSTEDEGPESPSTLQPAAKRMRFSSPAAVFNATSETPPTSTEESTDSHSTSVLYNSIQSPPGKNTFRRETNFVSTPFKSPNEETVIEQSETPSKSQHTVSTIVQSVATKRKSIFDLPSKKEEPLNTPTKTTSSIYASDVKPSFKPTLLGSPFYPGRTAYGGASSTYINQPNIKQRKTAYVNESKDNDNVGMSNSARRVLDLLENYSSPLMDAKRIQSIMKRSSAEDSLESSMYVPYLNPRNSISGYKSQELHVPSIASILRLKQRSRLMDTTKAARQIIASHSSTLSSFQPYVTDTQQHNRQNADQDKDPSKGKMTLKLKPNLTRPNRGDDVLEMPETVQLPTAVLQIDNDNLPTFSFGETPTQTTQMISSFPAVTSKSAFTQTPRISAFSGPDSFLFSSSTKATATETKPMNEMFKFSSPVKVSLDSQDENDSSPPKFLFDSPEKEVEKPKNTVDKSTSTLTVKKFDLPISKPSTDWKCPGCWIPNKIEEQKCICCGAKQPGKQENINEVVKIHINKFNSNASKIDPTNWKCDDCWINNDADADKCICCGLMKNAPVTEDSEKSVGKDWICGDCWIKNKSSIDKCAACGGAKPGGKSNDAANTATSEPSFFNSGNRYPIQLTTQKSNKWECSTCLVPNDNEKDSCVCCGMEKNGADKESTKKLFNFNTNANPTFKFGIDPKVQESSIMKKVEEKSEQTFKPIMECETNNNVVSKFPNMAFALSTKNLDDSKNDAPKPAFTFGMPKQSAPEPRKPLVITPVKFSELVKLPTEKTDKEKLQEVPKIEFRLPQMTEPAKAGYFAPPTSMNMNSQPNKPTSAFGSFVDSLSANKKEETPKPMLSIIQPDKSQAETTSSPNTFSFSVTGIKPTQGIGLFGMPPSTTSAAPTTGIQFGTLQSTPTTSTTPTMSIFQKPETINSMGLSMFGKPDLSAASTSATNLFQNCETTSTPSTATNSVPALFSFGSTTQQTTTSVPEKPKFSFSFGGTSSTENSTMFKPTFGSMVDSNTSSFALSSGNKLGGSNGISTSASGLGVSDIANMSGNALDVNNDMSSNGMSSNGMSNTGMSNNGMVSNIMGNSEMQTGNALSTSLFSQNVQKENNMWPNNNSNSSNVFGSNTSSNNMQKPALFTFGTPSPFNATNTAPNSQPTSNMFDPQPTQNVFGIPTQNNTSQQSLFTNPTQTQPPPNIFGSSQPNQTPAPALGMFGSSNVGATSAFGTPNSSMPNFESSSMTPTPAPAFNFGAPQAPAVFGFGQTPGAQPAQTGVYSFGGSAAGTPQQLQFNMGSAPMTAARRVRKAVRRNSQR